MEGLLELIPISDIYCDAVGAVDDLGGNCRVSYFTWQRIEPSGPLVRVVVCKLVRPITSLAAGNLATMLRSKSGRRLPDGVH